MPNPAETAEATLPLEGIADPAPQAPSNPPAKPARKGRELARPSEPLPPRSEAQAMLDMIAAAAANPKVNVDKMDRLLQMRDRIVAREKENAYFETMAACQIEMEPIRADAENPETKSKYASHAALDRALRPVYTRHGFSLTYDTEPHPLPEFMNFICYATARGHTRRHSIELPVDGKGPKGGAVMSRTHAASSGVTYAMRILLKMVFNIAVDRDDDGNAAGRTVLDNVDPAVPKVTEDQIMALREKCESVGCPTTRFLKHIRTARFDDIPAADFAAHIQLLGTFQRK